MDTRLSRNERLPSLIVFSLRYVRTIPIGKSPFSNILKSLPLHQSEF
jgi:hypothetical protein